MRKLIILGIVFMINLTIVSAQTGLFTAEGGTAFATAGIVIVVGFLVAREFVKRFRKK